MHAGRDNVSGQPTYVTRAVRGDRDAVERGLVALVVQITDSPTSPTFGTVGELCDKWWKYSSPWDWIVHNPARRATRPPARRPCIHLPSAGEVVGLIEAAHAVNGSLPIFLRLAAVTGARRGELCALQWQHVEFRRQTLHIAGQVAHTASGPVQRPTKTHAERVSPSTRRRWRGSTRSRPCRGRPRVIATSSATSQTG